MPTLDSLSLVPPVARSILPDPTKPLSSKWEGTIQSWIGAWARKTPGRTAIASSDGVWTYGQLDLMSSRIANALRGRGAQPQDIVAIYAHHSPELAVVLIGVLKAGAAFLLLDPSHPLERLIHTIRLVRPNGWANLQAAGEVPEDLAAELDMLARTHRLTIHQTADDIECSFGNYRSSDPGVAVRQDDLAYVGITSGTTGEPKAVLGRHGPLTHFLPWLSSTFELNEGDRYSLLSGLSTNILLRELFTCLSLGGCLCIPQQSVINNPRRLVEWLRQQEITITHLAPPALQRIVADAGQPPNDSQVCENLRYAFFVGDVLTRSDVAKLHTIAPRASCVNLYGSTESQRAVGYFVTPPEQERDGNSESAGIRTEAIPIGRGIEDVQLLVLASNLQLAGINEIGEIYVRSPHLALGYQRDDILTAERFPINHFTQDPGDRLLRTGDLGRFLPDGSVEALGRNEYHVKIRGFRVSLAEIEIALTSFAGIERAVVTTEGEHSERRLIAYFVAKPIPDLTELRRFLERRFPDYMIPSDFIALDALPLTPNGKVDRAAVPSLHTVSILRPANFVAPRNIIEQALCLLWLTVLPRSEVGVEDSFFQLGGHSLMVTRLMSRLRDVFGVEFPLKAFFEGPTVSVSAQTLVALGDRRRLERCAELIVNTAELSDDEVESQFVQGSSVDVKDIGKPHGR